jgi:biotin carboxyl carrier protein
VKLIARVDDQEHHLELVRDGKSLSVDIDGRVYSLEVHENEDGQCLLLDHSRVYDCRVNPVGLKEPDTFAVALGSGNFQVTLINPKKLRSSQAADHHHSGSAEIKAPMPGKIVRVLVEEGTEVEKGSGIIIVEAMKMQNEMKSPRAGVVKSVNVKPGDTVNAGDTLALIE